ncbi:hypothetical protein CRG98_003453 [Punica granatum]|uniref:Protein NIM1-INTERACTING 1 n=1 Tax=Punica granatum TaxID=22663 RepID=A0A2I0L5X3_PUNGR|nr:hypothetical protein CRG98_003453 [Punica granatum]
MEGDKKKRKAMEYDQQEADEDGKMEEFFALIRSTRDIRDHLIRSEAAPQEASKMNKREPNVWTPKFEPKDFAEGSRSCPAPPSETEEAGPSKEDDREDKEQGMRKDSSGLDLKLSL